MRFINTINMIDVFVKMIDESIVRNGMLSVKAFGAQWDFYDCDVDARIRSDSLLWNF